MFYAAALQSCSVGHQAMGGSPSVEGFRFNMNGVSSQAVPGGRRPVLIQCPENKAPESAQSVGPL